MTDSLAMPLSFAQRESGFSRAAWAVLAGIVGHGALLALALQQHPEPSAFVRVTEVELLEPSKPEPAAPAKPEALPPPVEPAAPKQVERRAPARSRAPAPQPASAAPLRTIEDNVKTSDEPVRFVTDPNGSAFGFGSVARGGTAKEGVARPVSPPPELASSGSKSGPAPLLSRAPMLGESEPCRGFFPARALVDRGEVALKVRIEADGRVRSVVVARESPSGQGFGFAARDCLLSKHFSPALDLAAEPVSVVSPITVRFSR